MYLAAWGVRVRRVGFFKLAYSSNDTIALATLRNTEMGIKAI